MRSSLTEVKSLTPLQGTIGEKRTRLFDAIVGRLQAEVYCREAAPCFEDAGADQVPHCVC